MGSIERTGTCQQRRRAGNVIIEQGKIPHGDNVVVVEVSEVQILRGSMTSDKHQEPDSE